ncbi:MAG: hypothetical protein IKG80_03860 [Clostridia bacterium]|nr:hypothetical protein [Clostridia bacterium]
MHPADRLFEKKWGVFNHYLYHEQNCEGDPHNQGAGETPWDECVRALDVERMADALSRIGAGYLFFTVMQGSAHMIAPNETFDRIAGTRPGEACATRDLIDDLWRVLSKRGIDLYLYYTGDGPHKHPEISKKFGFTDDMVPGGMTMEFAEKWASVLEEYCVKYGDKVCGWWIDGCYREWFGYNDEQLALYYNAIKKGNPAAIVAMNDGVNTRYRKYYWREDFVCGEMDDVNVIPKSRFIDGAQAHLLAPLGTFWAEYGSRYSGEYLKRFTELCNMAGGVVTYDIALGRDGSYDPEQIEALSAING